MRRYPGNFTDSDLLSVPRNLKVRPDHDTTHLAYITDKEADLLQKNKPGTPHKGPEGIPNYDGGDILDYRPTTPGLRESGYSGRVNPGGGRQPQDRPQNAQQEQRDRQQQEIINRNNANRIAAMNTANQQKPADKWGTRRMAEEKLTTFGGQTWGQETPVDYSYSTRDVRSSPDDRLAFTKRIAEGGGKTEVYTLAEQLARKAYDLTNDPKYLNMPIFIPEGLSDEEYKALLAKGNEALTTGDNQIFFQAMKGLEDITAGNPNEKFQQGFGTGYNDWYKSPSLQGGGGGGGGGGWGGGYGGGGGDGGGGGGGYGPPEKFTPRGQQGEQWGAQTPWQQIMINTHAGKGFQQGYARGGIVSLVT